MRRHLVGGALLALALVAQAGEFAVGRVEVVFAEDGWKEVPLPDTQRTYGGDRDGALQVQSRLFVLEPSGRDEKVLMLVSATGGGLGGGHMSYSPQCESDDDDYREGNTGIRRSFAQCLTVLPLYTSSSVFKVLAPEQQGLTSAGTLSVSRPLYSVMSRHAISTGVFLDVRLFLTTTLLATGGTVKETLPKGVPPEHVLWGRLLKEAVKSSVYSLSGRLEVPALRLTPRPAPSPASVAWAR